MKQIIQTLKSGNLSLNSVPPPALLPGGALVRTTASLISAGTEKMLIELAQKSLIGKAQARPDLVRQVLNKAKKEGWKNTFQNVMSKMERPMPLGYSAAGVIEKVGAEVTDLKVGDRVAMAGAGYANHAEINYVPKNLLALIPAGVSFEDAAYTTVASIALQGVRLVRPELGDIVAVNGLGLIGLIAVQLMKANGCRVIGIDMNPSKIELGLSLGMDEGVAISDDPHKIVERFTQGRGVDHTLITAATKSNQPVELAGEITRRKGQVVAVGAVGMNIPRDLYYKKEIEIKISMSYGPGRYDASYEEGGIDYPYDYVRWTEQRNMGSVLELMAKKQLNVRELTTHQYDFEEAMSAYQMISENKEPFVGIILSYDVGKKQETVLRLKPDNVHSSKNELGVGFIGAGNYAALHLLPHLKNNPAVRMEGLVTATGINSQQKADKFGFSFCSTEFQSVIDHPEVDSIFIATRHSTHAEMTVKALEAKKHVFVEKPMVVTGEQLEAVNQAYLHANELQPVGLMVGLNRRFAPMVEQLKQSFDSRLPIQMIYRVNSGHIPNSSWLHESNEGGGMLVGEMCHFVDLMQFLAASAPVKVYAHALSLQNQTIADQDNLLVTVSFANGSAGTLCYNTIGDKAASKERLELYGSNMTAVLDDFRLLQITKNGKAQRQKAVNQDKGQERQIKATVRAFLEKGTSPIPFSELISGMRVIFAARQSLVLGQPVTISYANPGSPD
ncbi:MAG: bi-domain-containing oxidoreductase [SAR324 cluster bacterium]|nr:bi-domain-containing oxidoreductase [SAR324 cluster bacterium]